MPIFQPSMANSCWLSRARSGGDAGSQTLWCSACAAAWTNTSSSQASSEPPPPRPPPLPPSLSLLPVKWTFSFSRGFKKKNHCDNYNVQRHVITFSVWSLRTVSRCYVQRVVALRSVNAKNLIFQTNSYKDMQKSFNIIKIII